MKRACDCLVAGLLLVVTAPIVAAAAIALWVDSGSPLLFRQARSGRGGQPFELVKFRTMVTGDNPVFPDAGRITGVGRILRRLSFDEVPQLLNVIRGDMSVIGPRPTLAYQVERYDDRQRRRLEVRPGVTGWAQLNGRNEIPWSDRIELDLEYIDVIQSPLADVRILARSVVSALRGGGVEGHPADDPLAKVEADG